MLVVVLGDEQDPYLTQIHIQLPKSSYLYFLVPSYQTALNLFRLILLPDPLLSFR